MKLISWNVNGLRSCWSKGFEQFFTEQDADIVCLQETKMQREQSKFSFPGYFEFWNSAEKKGYSGTLALTKTQPLSERYGIGIPEHDTEGRVITLEYDQFYLVNCYTPNAQRGLLRLDYRMRWEDDFRVYLNRLNETKPVVLCGDLNVAHKEIDIKNPKSNVKNAGFTPEERGKMTTLLEAGYTDSFRLLYPERKDAYTWWSYMANARERNVGWRIDYFIVSERLNANVKDAFILDQVTGSDHCPVGLVLEV